MSSYCKPKWKMDYLYPAGDSFTSSNNSLSIFLLSPTTCTRSRGHQRMEMAFLISLSSLLQPAAKMLLLQLHYSIGRCHHKVIESCQECQRTWASSADTVCSNLSYMLLQCDLSSPVYCSGELPGTWKMSPSHCPFLGCSLVFRVVWACGNPTPALWSYRC